MNHWMTIPRPSWILLFSERHYAVLRGIPKKMQSVDAILKFWLISDYSMCCIAQTEYVLCILWLLANVLLWKLSFCSFSWSNVYQIGPSYIQYGAHIVKRSILLTNSIFILYRRERTARKNLPLWFSLHKCTYHM
jgi:hypothetical protein